MATTVKVGFFEMLGCNIRNFFGDKQITNLDEFKSSSDKIQESLGKVQEGLRTHIEKNPGTVPAGSEGNQDPH